MYTAARDNATSEFNLNSLVTLRKDASVFTIGKRG